MIWVVFLLLVLVYGTFKKWNIQFLMGVIIGFTFVSVFMAGAIGQLPAMQSFKFNDYPLISLNQKDGINGQFLGTGTIRNTEYYFWYRKNPDGGIVGDKTVRSENVPIYESNNPVMTTYYRDYTSEFFRKYIWLFGFHVNRSEGIYYSPSFSIPKGSIQEGFKL